MLTDKLIVFIQCIYNFKYKTKFEINMQNFIFLFKKILNTKIGYM